MSTELAQTELQTETEAVIDSGVQEEQVQEEQHQEEYELMSLEYVNSLSASIEGFSFEGTAVAFVHQLVTPIFDTIKDSDDAEILKSWISTYLEETHATELLTILSEETNALSVKTAILMDFIQKSFFVGAQVSAEAQDATVTPWDIALGVTKDAGLNKVLQVQSTKVPLTITFKGYSANHEMSLPFVAGVLMFSLATNIDFNITICGQVLSPNYLLQETNRYLYNDTKQFVQLFELQNEMKFVVSDQETLQGFNTGAYWADVDAKKYWKNLFEVEEVNGEATLVNLYF